MRCGHDIEKSLLRKKTSVFFQAKWANISSYTIHRVKICVYHMLFCALVQDEPAFFLKKEDFLRIKYKEKSEKDSVYVIVLTVS